MRSHLPGQQDCNILQEINTSRDSVAYTVIDLQKVLSDPLALQRARRRVPVRRLLSSVAPSRTQLASPAPSSGSATTSATQLRAIPVHLLISSSTHHTPPRALLALRARRSICLARRRYLKISAPSKDTRLFTHTPTQCVQTYDILPNDLTLGAARLHRRRRVARVCDANRQPLDATHPRVTARASTRAEPGKTTRKRIGATRKSARRRRRRRRRDDRGRTRMKTTARSTPWRAGLRPQDAEARVLSR